MRKYLTITAFILVAAAFSGCNTVEGMGRDIENAGQSIQKL